MLKRSKLLLLLTILSVSACTKKKVDETGAVASNQNPNCASIDGEIRFSGTNIVMTNTSIYGGSVPNYNNFGYGTISMNSSQTFTNGTKLTNSNGNSGSLTLEVASGTGSNQYGYGNNNGGTYNNYSGNGSYQYVNFSASLTLTPEFRGHVRTYIQRQQYGSGYSNYGNNGYNNNNNNGYNNNGYNNNGYNNNGYNNNGYNNTGYPNPTDYNSACVSGVALNLGYSRDVNNGQPRELRNGQVVLYLNNSQNLYYTIPF